MLVPQLGNIMTSLGYLPLTSMETTEKVGNYDRVRTLQS